MAFECPSCHQQSISIWQKIITAPSIKVRCKNCNTRVHETGLISFFSNVIGYFLAIYLGFLLFLYQDLFHGVLFVSVIVLGETIKVKFSALKAVE